MKKLIQDIEKNSIAEELGIKGGDWLAKINNKSIIDVFDYKMELLSDYIEVLIKKSDGDEYIFEIEKDEDEDLGLVFCDGLMSNPRQCNNNCIFCFIHQNPNSARQTLHFKDDDYRLSYLHGNYITLTNMGKNDIERIIGLRLSPLNISIHSTDPNIRAKMLQNSRAGDVLPYLEQLSNARIQMNFQIVLCKGYNDGKNLDKTIEDLGKFVAKGETNLSVVPAGLTKFRDQNNLPELEPFTQSECLEIINQIEGWQSIFLEKYGTRFVYCADEFYILAQKKEPSYKTYEDFGALENGIGMLSLIKHDFYKHLPKIIDKAEYKSYTIATGLYAYNTIKELAEKLEQKFAININVMPIKNDFYGHSIKVSGLMVGADIINQLKGKSLGDILLLPANCLKTNENILLDDCTIGDIEKALSIKIKAVPTTAEALIKAIQGQPLPSNVQNEYELG